PSLHAALPLSLHDALPFWAVRGAARAAGNATVISVRPDIFAVAAPAARRRASAEIFPGVELSRVGLPWAGDSVEPMPVSTTSLASNCVAAPATRVTSSAAPLTPSV